MTHGPDDDDHRQHDHGDEEEPEDGVEGGVAGRRGEDAGKCHALARVEAVTPARHTVAMVMVAPELDVEPHVEDRGGDLGEPRIARHHPVPTRGRTGRDLLALLRGDLATRPRFEPGLSGGLRAWLEDAAYDVVAVRGEHAPPLFIGARRLLDGARPAMSPLHAAAPRDDPDSSRGVRLPHLVHALFRLLVHNGAIDDPLSDALAAAEASGSIRLVSEVRALPLPDRVALAESLAMHTHNLVALLPRLAPGWMPRTDDRVAIPLAGGRVVLHGTFDLLIGIPHPPTASTCALGLSTGAPWPQERRNLHYLALLETLRSGVPPFRLALIDSGTGRSGVEDVREEHLRAVTSHVAAWLSREAVAGA